MKPSLEEERRALLEQIEASRAVYRRMLAGDEKSAAGSMTAANPRTSRGAQTFPRSRTVRWVMDHPWWVAFGVAAVVWAGPGGLKKVFGRARAAQPRGKTAVKGMTSLGAMLLRDQSKLRAAGRLAVMSLGLVQRWRARKKTVHSKPL